MTSPPSLATSSLTIASTYRSQSRSKGSCHASPSSSRPPTQPSLIYHPPKRFDARAHCSVHSQV